MDYLKLLFEVLSSIVIVMSVIPLIRNDYWAFRVFEYPRFQKLVLSIILFIGLVVIINFSFYSFSGIVAGLLLLNIFYLIYQIYPFTFASKKQVLKAGKEIPEQSIALLTANVYQYNRNAKAYLKNIELVDPDVVLLLEIDDWWYKATSSLKERYPYHVDVPAENTYGMLLYSRFKLVDHKVHHLVEDNVPSIHAVVEIPCGKKIQLYCVHPTPPVPNENPKSTERDKELLLIAKLARKCKLPVVVLGDLNDVAWSYTTELFGKISGLLDPRKGRGFYSTFHAGYPLLRFPLDHIFCSVDFKLIHLSKLPSAGSDHFPIYAKLQYEKIASIQQEEPSADSAEIELANEKVEKRTG